jgi:hypothetical protein
MDVMMEETFGPVIGIQKVRFKGYTVIECKAHRGPNNSPCHSARRRLPSYALRTLGFFGRRSHRTYERLAIWFDSFRLDQRAIQRGIRATL